MFPQHHSRHDDAALCPETADLLARLDRAGVRYELSTLADVVSTDSPLFFYPQDF